MTCCLCGSSEIIHFASDEDRDYAQCLHCGIVFVPMEYHLSSQDEYNHYKNHENNPEDKEYRKFLSKLFSPLSKILEPKSNGLDFGCGPGPTLSVMFSAAGYEMEIYDLFFCR